MTAYPRDPFDHPALLYRDAEEYLAGTLPFITDGLAAGEPVAVSVPGTNLRLLRGALGADARRVLLHDMSVVGRNPGRIIPGVLLAFADAHPGCRIRIIGEPIWVSRSRDEYPACVQHEALINTAFAGRDAAILCPYDAAALPPAWIGHAERTHPTIVTATRRWDSPHFADPVAVAADFNEPLPDPPPRAARIRVGLDNLPEIRSFVVAEAGAAGLRRDQAVDLMIAVNELAANTVEHAGGGGNLAVWTESEHLICQLRDEGHIKDPMAGRLPVPADHPDGGRGLLLVHRLCDLVRIYTTPEGTTIRVHVRCPVPEERDQR
jgi:anti-sigma regulatory factor (Ser/Thr protein kinase)